MEKELISEGDFDIAIDKNAMNLISMAMKRIIPNYGPKDQNRCLSVRSTARRVELSARPLRCKCMGYRFTTTASIFTIIASNGFDIDPGSRWPNDGRGNRSVGHFHTNEHIGDRGLKADELDTLAGQPVSRLDDTMFNK